MVERFQLGSVKPDGERVTYPRILSYAATCDGSSCLASAADVVLGTFAYCVNERREHVDHPYSLFPRLVPLLWRSRRSSDPWNGSLALNPPYVRSAHARDYRELKQHLKGLGLES